MGFYLACKKLRELTDDFLPTITAREYISIFSRSATERTKQASDTYGRGGLCLTIPRHGPAFRALSARLQRHPFDPVAHRTLAVVHLDAGHIMTAAKHLEVALWLLTRAAATETSLIGTLRIHWEAAAVRLLLLLAYSNLGWRESAHRLALEDLVPPGRVGRHP
jgi:hypothetical protein